MLIQYKFKGAFSSYFFAIPPLGLILKGFTIFMGAMNENEW